MATFKLVRPLRQQNGGGSAEQYLHIQSQRPVLDVPDVKQDHLVETELTASANLPQSCQPGRCLEASAMPVLVVLDFDGDRRSRADQAHISPQDVAELNELVHAK